MAADKRPYFYEDFAVGQRFHTRSQTITAGDVEAFRRITGDQNPIHAPSPKSPRALVHGMLTASIGTGLISALGLTTGSIVAMLEQHIQYTEPVYAGDTVQAQMEVVEKKPTRNPKRGVVIYEFELVNDQQTHVMKARNTILVKTTNGEKK